MGQKLDEAGETKEKIIYGAVDPAAADCNPSARQPGLWEFDRIAKPALACARFGRHEVAS